MQKNKYDPEIIRGIHQIIELAYLINTDTTLACFMNYSGNTESINVYLRPNKNTTDDFIGKMEIFFLDSSDAKLKLAETIARLQRTLEENRTEPKQLII